MGIYDRDYYRQGPSYLESLLPSGLACKWLIGINVAVFIAQMATKPGHGGVGSFTELFWLDPQKVVDGQVWRLLTYAFLHSPDNLMHILFNMLFLWWFGSDVEMLYGWREFSAFYLLSAVLGGIVYTGCSYAGLQAMGPCVGASGAVTAVLVLCACHFPRRQIYVFFVVPLPLWCFALFNFASDAYQLLRNQSTGNSTGVAVSVHVAGAVFAFAYFKQHWRLTDVFTGWSLPGPRRRARPRLRLFRPEDAEALHEPVPVGAPASDAAPFDEHLEAKLDAVLEKLARSGKESLTDSERQILLRASEIYKRRRT